jgi:hypothetical protein
MNERDDTIVSFMSSIEKYNNKKDLKMEFIIMN